MKRTTVRISRIPIIVDGKQTSGYVGGTGWFLDLNHIVTVEHVAVRLAEIGTWTTIEVFQVAPWKGSGTHYEHIPVRIVGFIRTNESDNLAILELKTPFGGVQIANISTEPLVLNERIVSVGFPDGLLRIVRGRYLGLRDFKNVDNANRSEHRIEVDDRGDRSVFGAGASGSPIFDCSGRVKLVLSDYLVGAIVDACNDDDPSCSYGSKTSTFTPPAGSATNLGVPTTGLIEFAEVLQESKTH